MAVYRYVESKEALFDLIVRSGAVPEQSFDNLKLPVATPNPRATLRFLRETLWSRNSAAKWHAREASFLARSEAVGRAPSMRAGTQQREDSAIAF
jgi:hypothetical protein